MASKITANKNAGRVELGKVLPLDTPFSVQMHVANVCNFKCGYCLQSYEPSVLKGMSFSRKFMNLDLYKKIIQGLTHSKSKLKVLVLVGWGEPLIHPDIIEMIRYAKHLNIADKIEVITNASALTPELTNQLVESGLDSMRISIQGLCSKEYMQVSGTEIDFDVFVSNLKYFYAHKKDIHVYIKIMDIMLKDANDKDKFFSIFGNLCDEIAVESLIPILSEFDYSEFGSEFKNELLGNKIVETEICALPFYSCNIDVSGNLLPCCVFPPPAEFKNVSEAGLHTVWNSPEYRAFLTKLLNREKSQMPVCKDCERHTHVMRPSDYLDKYVPKLLDLYK